MLKSIFPRLTTIKPRTNTAHKMTLKTLSAKSASALDAHLMSPQIGFSIDQLMELAGLSVASCIHTVTPPTTHPRVLLACGPGNNGGDGLVCARHLRLFGYTPTVFYPKPTKQPIFEGLQKQLKALNVAFTEDFESELKQTDVVVDALFGFSFHPPVRKPFDEVLQAMIKAEVPVLSVDIPSSWDVDAGPPGKGELGSEFMPEFLISLTAPKPCVKFYKGRHFVGGRFLGKEVAEMFGLDVQKYQGTEQVVEVPVPGEGNVEKL